MGICLDKESHLNHGIGTKSLKLWLDYLFEKVTDLPHIGFTTGSGNQGMIRIGEKIGMQQEARIRKIRYWRGRYWNSFKYGILRSE